MMWHRLLTILLMLSVLAGSSCCCCVLQAAASAETAARQFGCCCVSDHTDSCPAEPAAPDEPPHQCPCRSSLTCTAERDRPAGLSLTAAVVGFWPDPGRCLPGLLVPSHAHGTALLERCARRLQCLPGGAARLTALCVQLC